MASSSFAAATPLLGQTITEKLSKTNFPLWKAQVMPMLRGAQLQGYLDGTNVAPPAEIDGKVGEKATKMPTRSTSPGALSGAASARFLMTSLSRDVVAQVATLETPHVVYTALEQMYASASRARAVNTRIALATTQKGNMSITMYVGKMRSLADDMAAAGKPIGDEELVSYILAGLDIEYNPLVLAIVARVEPITVGELFSQL